MTKQHCKEFPNYNGFCEWDDQHGAARIRICPAAQSIDHAIVHELLHVLLEGDKPFEERNPTSGWEVKLNTLATVITGVKL